MEDRRVVQGARGFFDQDADLRAAEDHGLGSPVGQFSDDASVTLTGLFGDHPSDEFFVYDLVDEIPVDL